MTNKINPKKPKKINRHLVNKTNILSETFEKNKEFIKSIFQDNKTYLLNFRKTLTTRFST
jgi:hypothetical protein